MTALVRNITYKQVAEKVASLQVPVKGSVQIYQGAMVALLTASGYAVPAGTAGTGRVIGVAHSPVSLPATDGANDVNVFCGPHAFALHASHTPTILDVGKAVYASDDNTLSNLPSDGPVAGTLVGFEATSGWGIVDIEPPDSSVTGLGSLRLDLMTAILAAGTPMAAFADNASSNPGVTLNDSKAVGIRWNNNATPTAVWTRSMWPRDMDPSYAATLVITAAKTGATSGDATTFTVTAFKNATGALDDADTNFGGVSSAMVGTAAAKTVQQVTLSLAAANLGVGGDAFSISIAPTAGTQGTDDVSVYSIELQYRKKS